MLILSQSQQDNMENKDAKSGPTSEDAGNKGAFTFLDREDPRPDLWKMKNFGMYSDRGLYRREGARFTSPTPSESRKFEDVPHQAGWDLTDSEDGCLTPNSTESNSNPGPGSAGTYELLTGNVNLADQSSPSINSSKGSAYIDKFCSTGELSPPGLPVRGPKINFKTPSKTSSQCVDEAKKDSEVVDHMQEITVRSSGIHEPTGEVSRPEDPDSLAESSIKEGLIHEPLHEPLSDAEERPKFDSANEVKESTTEKPQPEARTTRNKSSETADSHSPSVESRAESKSNLSEPDVQSSANKEHESTPVAKNDVAAEANHDCNVRKTPLADQTTGPSAFRGFPASIANKGSRFPWHWTQRYGLDYSTRRIVESWSWKDTAGWWTGTIRQEILDFAATKYCGNDARVTPVDCDRIEKNIAQYDLAYQRRWEVTPDTKKKYYEQRAIQSNRVWRASLEEVAKQSDQSWRAVLEKAQETAFKIERLASDGNPGAAIYMSQRASWDQGSTTGATQGSDAGAYLEEEGPNVRALGEEASRARSRSRSPPSDGTRRISGHPTALFKTMGQTEQERFARELFDNKAYFFQRNHGFAPGHAQDRSDKSFPHQTEEIDRLAERNRISMSLNNEEYWKRVAATGQISNPKTIKQEENVRHENLEVQRDSQQVQNKEQDQRWYIETTSSSESAESNDWSFAASEGESKQAEGYPEEEAEEESEGGSEEESEEESEDGSEEDSEEGSQDGSEEDPEEESQDGSEPESKDDSEDVSKEELKQESSKSSLISDRKIAFADISAVLDISFADGDDDEHRKRYATCLWPVLLSHGRPGTRRFIAYKLHNHRQRHNPKATFDDVPFLMNFVELARQKRQQKLKRQREIAAGFCWTVVAFFVALTAFCAALPHSKDSLSLIKGIMGCFELLVLGSIVGSTFWVAFLPCVPGVLIFINNWFGVGESLIKSYKTPQLASFRNLVGDSERILIGIANSVSGFVGSLARFYALYGQGFAHICRANALCFCLSGVTYLLSTLHDIKAAASENFQEEWKNEYRRIVRQELWIHRWPEVKEMDVKEMDKKIKSNAAEFCAQLEKLEKRLGNAEELVQTMESSHSELRDQSLDCFKKLEVRISAAEGTIGGLESKSQASEMADILSKVKKLDARCNCFEIVIENLQSKLKSKMAATEGNLVNLELKASTAERLVGHLENEHEILSKKSEDNSVEVAMIGARVETFTNKIWRLGAQLENTERQIQNLGSGRHEAEDWLSKRSRAIKEEIKEREAEESKHAHDW